MVASRRFKLEQLSLGELFVDQEGRDEHTLSAVLRRYVCVVLLVVATAGSLLGCYGAPLTTREKGTLIGGAAGAGAGALIGSAVGAPGAGAAIGGLAGAGTGYVIGNHIQSEQIQRRYGDY